MPRDYYTKLFSVRRYIRADRIRLKKTSNMRFYSAYIMARVACVVD